tara:strand:- start:59 stop:298 length:240 start_codon:yes stop_codon:yes gene_type:complete
MTFHRNPLAVMRAAINKAVTRASHKRVKHKGIKNSEAYARAVEENKRLGIPKPRKRIKELSLRQSKRKITLPKLKCLEE